MLYFENFDRRTISDDIIEFLQRWGEIQEIEIFYDDKGKWH